MKYTAILVDDEYTNLEVLQYEIEQLSIDIEILGTYEDPVDGLTAIKELKPDLIFLDIEMPRLNGFEVLDILGDDHDSKVIFVTAYNKYAVEAFQYHVIDYLVKPVSAERLDKAVTKVISRKTKTSSHIIADLANDFKSELNNTSKIVVPITSGFQMIAINDILRCAADNNYSKIFLADGSKILVSKSLIEFEKMLTKVNFLRVHQSHLVNMQYVSQYIKSDGGHLLLDDGFQVPISRSQKTKLTEYFKNKSI